MYQFGFWHILVCFIWSTVRYYAKFIHEHLVVSLTVEAHSSEMFIANSTLEICTRFTGNKDSSLVHDGAETEEA